VLRDLAKFFDDATNGVGGTFLAPCLGRFGEISVSRDSSNSAASRETDPDPKRERECSTEARSVAQA